MSVTRITSGSGINNGIATLRHGSSKFMTRNTFDQEFRDFDVTAHNNRNDGNYGEWSMGLGATVDSTGNTYFDSATYGGSLSSLVISNNGDQVLHYSINSDNPSLGSGTFPLATGVAIVYDSAPITKLWAITASGLTTTLNAHGPYAYNPNTI